MLTPEYLLRISEGAEEIAEELHQDILNRIIERIMARLDRGDNYILTAYDKWQLQVLQDAGYLNEDIIKDIAAKTKLMQQEVAEAMEDAGVKSYDYDSEIYEAVNIFSPPLEQSPHYIRMMQRNYEKTLGEMQNFTGTLANAAQQSFIQGCDKAYNLVLSGAVGYSQAVKEVVNEIVKDGVKVQYTRKNPVTGLDEVYHEDTIETATLRAVRTGVAQACADITTARMDEYDWDIVLVSSHLGARVTDQEDFTNHYWWQGKFYSRSGKDKRFKPFSVCNKGHVQGICGANCRHSYGPGDGEFNPYDQYDSEENRKAYETEQRQRLLERRIRNTKREVMGLQTARDNASDDITRAEFDLEYQRKAALLQKQNKAYNDYCNEHNLKKRAERIEIARWDRKQAAAARGAAKEKRSATNDQNQKRAKSQKKESFDIFETKIDTINKRIKQIEEEVASSNDFNRWIELEAERDDLIRQKDDVLKEQSKKRVKDVERRINEKDYFATKGTGKGYAVDLEEADEKTIVEIEKGLDKMFEKFPQLKNKLSGIKIGEVSGELTLGNCESMIGGITLSDKYFTRYAYLADTLEESVKSGFHALSSVSSVVAHEMGHAVDLLLTRNGDIFDISKIKKGFGASKDIKKRVMKTLNLTNADIKENLSGYATYSDVEWFAEGFSEYVASDAPRAIAKAIGEEVERMLEELF